MNRAGDWQKPVQCLYCEAELKNFRGLFDEDFCSREHREKYLASFRKALTQLPDALNPVAGARLFPDAPPSIDFSQDSINSEVPEAPRVPEVQNVTVSYLSPEAATEASQPPPSGPADFLKTPLAAAPASFSPGAIPNTVIAARDAVKPALLPFSAAYDTKSLSVAGAIDPTLYALQLVSAPVCAPEFPLAHEGFFPAFTPSRASMAREEGDAESAPHGSHAPTEIAPALVLTAGPVTSTFSSPARTPEMMPPAFGIASSHPAASPAQFNVPGLSLNAPAQPGTLADISISHQKAANQAQPHAHEPLRPTFGSSVRIKNWRLRINFAKPA